MVEITHMIGHEDGAELRTGLVKSMRTRCGRTINRPMVEGAPARYTLVAHNGNQFFCTTRELFVSCIKCSNLVTAGTIHVKKINSRKG